MTTRKIGEPGAPPTRIPTGRTRRMLRRAALVLWGVALGAYALYSYRTDLGPLDVLVAFATFLGDRPLGVLAFVLVYAIRPLAAFSASLLSVAAGALYGPLAGIVLVIVGANLSALVAYGLGRGLGAELAGPALAHRRLAGVTARLRERTFETVLALRLMFVPFDAVNYLAGASRLRPRPFLLATAIGSLPGTAVFVLFGAGIADLSGLEAGQLPAPDARLLAASATLLVVSLLAARTWRRRDALRAESEKVRTAAEELR